MEPSMIYSIACSKNFRQCSGAVQLSCVSQRSRTTTVYNLCFLLSTTITTDAHMYAAQHRCWSAALKDKEWTVSFVPQHPGPVSVSDLIKQSYEMFGFLTNDRIESMRNAARLDVSQVRNTRHSDHTHLGCMYVHNLYVRVYEDSTWTACRSCDYTDVQRPVLYYTTAGVYISHHKVPLFSGGGKKRGENYFLYNYILGDIMHSASTCTCVHGILWKMSFGSLWCWWDLQ